jgi:hypothetical protein
MFSVTYDCFIQFSVILEITVWHARWSDYFITAISRKRLSNNKPRVISKNKTQYMVYTYSYTLLRISIDSLWISTIYNYILRMIILIWGRYPQKIRFVQTRRVWWRIVYNKIRIRKQLCLEIRSTYYTRRRRYVVFTVLHTTHHPHTPTYPQTHTHHIYILYTL